MFPVLKDPQKTQKKKKKNKQWEKIMAKPISLKLYNT